MLDLQAHPVGTTGCPQPRPSGFLSADPLDALLGRTRAHVLRAIADSPCTTSELATRAAAPLSTVSRHASILRDAGLITSHRDRNTVLHTITPLGISHCQGHTLA
ncbi:winged helix-turn-helix domain-containing protein [Streptomyces sp. NPDC127064]|uniref:winged helix-turn-helix domain-containing protein n=1 Tax=Streptomyces sp. NPDC127064 TaxID=3347124 RepID=UPI003654F329